MKKICTILLLLVLVACSQPVAPTPPPAPTISASSLVQPTVAASPATPTVEATPTPAPTTIAVESTPEPTVPPFTGTPCGVALPAILPSTTDATTTWQMPFIDETLIPEDVLPALERFFTNPDDVSLVVYKVGYEGVGFYHNEDQPMPLASVSKLIQLATYANQVDSGTVDPNQLVEEAELEQFYLPQSDLNSHQRALAAHGEQAITLGDVASMMIRFSSNTATDYLHELLGQSELEQTVIDLGMTQHSAPCSFIGRFLIMGDGSEQNSDNTIRNLAADETRYGLEVASRTDRYLNDATYSTEAAQHWRRRRTPTIATQALFVNELETRGTAADYAQLMARIVQGQIGSADTNRQIRSYLEWPYLEFSSNQERYQTIGYKNGTLPGVLTSVYYSWPIESDQPYALALFYKNLPTNVYQQWRRNLPHDAFAHWLMSDPNALHIMHVLRDSALRE